MHVRESNVPGRRRDGHTTISRTQVAQPGLRIGIRTDKEQVAHCLAVWCEQFIHQLKRPGRYCYRYGLIEDCQRLIRNVDRSRISNHVRLPVASGERRTVVGIDMNFHRLSRAGSRGRLLNPEVDSSDIVFLATGEVAHVKGAPVTVVGVAKAIVTRHRVAAHDLLARGLGNGWRTVSTR
jgi:hypothetical protein